MSQERHISPSLHQASFNPSRRSLAKTQKATIKAVALTKPMSHILLFGSRHQQHGSIKPRRASKAMNGSCLNGKSLLRRNPRGFSWAHVSKNLASLADESSNPWDLSTLLSPVANPDEAKSHNQSRGGSATPNTCCVPDLVGLSRLLPSPKQVACMLAADWRHPDTPSSTTFLQWPQATHTS